MNEHISKKIFIAPLNWGLGHATRILPLIRKFIDRGDKVYVAAHDRAKLLLKSEVPDCVFLEFPEYPIKYPRTRFFVTRFMLIIFPQMLNAMYIEKQKLKYLHRKYNFDYIISDNRFCLYLKDAKNYLISHQLRYKLPKPVTQLEWLPEYFNYKFFKNYDKIIVPDECSGNSLTGELSHDLRFLSKGKLYYCGIINDIDSNIKSTTKDVDYFIVVSGPEPQRTKLEKIIFKQVNSLKGNIIVALGRPERNYKIKQGNAIFYTYLNRKKMHEYLSRAKFIISRPGYTTVMEMIPMVKKGLFIPTPGQIEQEYLAKYYKEKKWCHSVPQHKLNLVNDVEKAETFSGFPVYNKDGKENVDRLIKEYFV